MQTELTIANTQLKAIIVDDEAGSRENTRTLLSDHCPEIEVVACADSASSAREMIAETEPDIIFLDIQMPGENGFDLLGTITTNNLFVVFITAHDHYGIQAVKASAVDYLLKPLSPLELRNAVGRVHALHSQRQSIRTSLDVYRESLAELTSSLLRGTAMEKIVFPTNEGLVIGEIKDVIRIESTNHYTMVYRADSPKLMLSKSLREFEDVLDNRQFVRIHNSHVINMAYLQRFSRKDGGFVEMTDGTHLPVSRRRQELLLEMIRTYKCV